jgi:hypothetical protein
MGDLHATPSGAICPGTFVATARRACSFSSNRTSAVPAPGALWLQVLCCPLCGAQSLGDYVAAPDLAVSGAP